MPANPFVKLMRRYCYDYTNCHNFSVCAEIISPDYILHMGSFSLKGRDEHYMPAAAKQFEQFPGLCLTINNIICNGDRLLLHFCEHGASVKHNNARAAWSGIGLYKWDGKQLLENRVEQDYFSRRQQLASGNPDRVESVAIAPWDTNVLVPNSDIEDIVDAYICDNNLAEHENIVCDDAWLGRPTSKIIELESVTVNDLFSAGKHVAFQIVQHGTLLDDFCSDEKLIADKRGSHIDLHLAGYCTVENNQIVAGRVIRDRLGLYRRLTSAV